MTLSRTVKRITAVASAAVLTIGLAACSGAGGGDDTPVTTEPEQAAYPA